MALQIQLQNFTGPLDLLLHLIKSHEMDICDIRIFEITEQYLTVIEQMKQLDLDIAGEFLMMAATLIHIKSRMLLPLPDDGTDEEEDDPRAELVRRLLEYQRYKEAGQLFDTLLRLDRDVFVPCLPVPVADGDETGQEAQITASLFQLAQAFYEIVRNQEKVEPFHEVVRESVSVADTMKRIRSQFVNAARLNFCDLVESGGRIRMVVSFLAILELIKMKILTVDQVAPFGDIWLKRLVTAEELTGLVLAGELGDYD